MYNHNNNVHYTDKFGVLLLLLILFPYQRSVKTPHHRQRLQSNFFILFYTFFTR